MDELGVPRAFVIRVKKGSVAEKVGHLKPGDEIVMWNGHNFRGASVDEVYKAILATKDENSASQLCFCLSHNRTWLFLYVNQQDFQLCLV